MDHLLDTLTLMHPAGAMLVIIAMLAVVSSASAGIGILLGKVLVDFIHRGRNRVRITQEHFHG